MSLKLSEETLKMSEIKKPEALTSGPGFGPAKTCVNGITLILADHPNLDKRGFVSQRFIKYIPGDEATWLRENYPFAFLLLSLVAERAGRTSNTPDGRQVCEAYIGDWKSIGATRQQYRTALKVLCDKQILQIIETNRTRKKSTNGTTTEGTKVRLLKLDIWDINIEMHNHPNNHCPTTAQPLPNHDKEYKNDKNDKKKKIFLSDSVEIGLAELLFKKIALFLDNPKIPDFQKWAVEVDYMIRIDKRDPEDIRKMIEWLHSAGPIFWRKNVLSTAKLREKWDRLKAELKAPTTFGKPKVDRSQRKEDGSLSNPHHADLF
jgi:hypothetical protein